MSDQLETIVNIEKEFHQIVKRIFPNNFLQSSGSSGLHFTAQFSNQNLYFQNTEYSYKDDLEFFHLTNYRNLFSILNSRSIRLYNLHNANDDKEYEYSANLIGMSPEEKERRKNNIYTFSFCPNSELENKCVWEEYGENFEGVAIVFKIDNDPKDWNNYHLAEVKYNLSSDIKEYAEKLKELKLKYPNASFDLGLEKLMSFYKESKWKGEKEVRILTYKPHRYIEEWLKFCKRDLKIEEGRNRFTRYIELPLWVDNSSLLITKGSEEALLDRRQNLPEDYFIKHPKIKIKDILFGSRCGLNNEKYDTFREGIEDTIRYNLGYEVKLNLNLFSPQDIK